MFRHELLISISVLLIATVTSNFSRGQGLLPPLTPTKAVDVLKTSRDHAYLEKAAMVLIRSQDPADIDKLLPFLTDADFLQRVDLADDYKYSRPLRINRILRETAKHHPTKAEAILLKLADDKTFASQSARLYGILVAMRFIKNPTPKLLAFLEKTGSTRGSSLARFAIDALVSLSTPESARLVERYFLSPDIPADEKTIQVLWSLIFVRHNPDILDLYGRLFQANLKDASLREILVLSLFDYRLEEWYPTHLEPANDPPMIKDAAPEVLKQLQKLADLALKVDVPDETKNVVRKARKEIDDRLGKLEKPKK
jgi:hypothetical protein